MKGVEMKFNIPTEFKYKSGIYIIRNSVNHKVYIGSAMNLRNRFVAHRNKLICKQHKSPQLQSFVNKYGVEVLSFHALEYCEIEDILTREQYYLDNYKPFDKSGFNTMKVAGSPKGFKHSEESKLKVSLAHKGRKHTSEARKNMKVGQQNRTNWNLSEEGKQKRRLAYKDKVVSEYTRQLISIAHKGTTRSSQAKENMSKAHLGKNLSNSQKINQSIEMLERNPFGKLVINLETGVFYDSGIQAAKAHGLNPVGLNRKLRGERRNNTQFILA